MIARCSGEGVSSRGKPKWYYSTNRCHAAPVNSPLKSLSSADTGTSVSPDK